MQSRPSLSIRVNGELSIPRLVTRLSRPSLLPSSAKTRNKLIRPYTFPSVHRGPIPDPDPLDSFLRSYGSSSLIAAFGDVPADILAGFETPADVGAAEDDEELLWALAVLTPAYSTPSNQQAAPRLDFWMSSEPSLNRYDAELNGAGRDAAALLLSGDNAESLQLLEREKDLFRRIAIEWLPSALRSIHDSERAVNAELASIGVGSSLPVRFCGVAQRYGEILEELSSGTVFGAPDRCGGSTPFTLSQPYANPCVAHVRILTEASATLQVDSNSGWECGEIRKDDIPVVQSTNKIPFPAQYIREHLHVSAAVRSTSAQRVGAEGVDMAPGQPIAWAYGHDDLSLASVYVLPSHRRRRIPLELSSSNDANAIGLGTLVVRSMERKVVDAQQHALRCVGVPSDRISAAVAPCLANSEIGSDARGFFEKIGFQPAYGITFTQALFRFV